MPTTLFSRTPPDRAPAPRALGHAPVPRDHSFPRWVLWCAAAVLLGTVALAYFGRHAGHVAPATAGPPLAARALYFTDRPDNGIDITDATTGRLIQTVTGQAGFLRATVRGLASARRRSGIGPTIPFQLASWPDGRLTLDDTTTGRHVELEAFGPTNFAVFAALLQHPETPRPAATAPPTAPTP